LPALRSTKVLDQLRERIRLLQYSRRTEEARSTRSAFESRASTSGNGMLQT